MLFRFEQIVSVSNSHPTFTLVHKISAPTHLDAFKKWCKLPAINDLDSNDLGLLTVTILQCD